VSPEARAQYVTEDATGYGMLIAVVGPSGSGKDTLIDYGRKRLGRDPSILFVRRVVTRVAQANAEDHETLSVETFCAAEASRKFAVTWEAHGLRYAIPVVARYHVARGGIAVINGSRAALPAIRSAFNRVMTVNVACRPEILEARLAARGREDVSQQRQRLSRATMPSDIGGDAVVIDNSGELAAAGDAFLAAISSAKRRR
jgi:ribose 1,5-bisphosphokinase